MMDQTVHTANEDHGRVFCLFIGEHLPIEQSILTRLCCLCLCLCLYLAVVCKTCVVSLLIPVIFRSSEIGNLTTLQYDEV